MSIALNDAAQPSALPVEDPGVLVVPSTGSIPRRHDLDALRAIAMLLGIALHGAISFIPMPGDGWAVQDVNQSEGFSLFMAMIHGFRMPLFFLISGFFTAMLWRKRGLKPLLWQRVKRILLPLVIGLFTIVPLIWIVIIAAASFEAGAPPNRHRENLWNAVASGDIDQIETQIAAGVDLDKFDPVYGRTPLSTAVQKGKLAPIELLLSAGAEINARNRDGSTALHAAAFWGRSEAFDLLLANQADISARDRSGQTAIETLSANWGRTTIITGMFGAPVDQDSLFNQRREIIDRLESSETENDDAPTPFATTLAAEKARVDFEEKTATLSLLFLVITLFPVFHHLWFLWFLCWLVAAFALYALVAERLPWKLPSSMVLSPLRYAWLIPLTFIPQAMMGLLGPAFGPDTSTGLLPIPEILAYYTIFFFFGVIYFDSDDQKSQLGRHWYLTLPIAILVVFPIAYEMASGTWGFTDQWLDTRWYRPLAVFLQVLYVWLMSFGLMGIFRRFCRRENRTMRYVSDSSYWLYLAHLPLIIALQFLVRNWELPAFAKFTLVCALTTAILLASYQLFIRYTPIGTLLNGPRTRPEKIVDAELVA